MHRSRYGSIRHWRLAETATVNVKICFSLFAAALPRSQTTAAVMHCWFPRPCLHLLLRLSACARRYRAVKRLQLWCIVGSHALACICSCVWVLVPGATAQSNDCSCDALLVPTPLLASAPASDWQRHPNQQLYVCINPVMYLNDVRIFCSVTIRNVFHMIIQVWLSLREIYVFFLFVFFLSLIILYSNNKAKVISTLFYICIILNVTISLKVQLLNHFFDKLQKCCLEESREEGENPSTHSHLLVGESVDVSECMWVTIWLSWRTKKQWIGELLDPSLLLGVIAWRCEEDFSFSCIWSLISISFLKYCVYYSLLF